MTQKSPLLTDDEDRCIDCDRPDIDCTCEDRLRCSCGVPASVCPCAYSDGPDA